MRAETLQFINTYETPAYLAAYADPSEEDVLEAETAVRRRLPVRVRLPFKLNAMTLGIVLLAAAVTGGISYFVVSNHLISQGFALNEARERVALLSAQNRELELLVMQSESYERVTQRVAGLQMVSAGDVEYVEIKNTGVALR